MRTTVEFQKDTAAAIQRLRRQTGMGVSEAVNELIRRGLLARTESVPFVQKTHRLGLKIDVSNVAEALEVLEGRDAR
ncbi:MAG TPA: ribbon-helix-helix protein, CopG family [Acidimicrobiia bacterium]|nr:ribbon-helix-helix protein, CopG family [Acidimicrobiia bacterium]